MVENKKYTEYLITMGCSFTVDWPYFFGKIVNREVINNGRGGVGNFYIVNKLYETIDTSGKRDVPHEYYPYKYNSDNSIVIVMWSGIDRIDLMVNDEEFYHFKRVDSRDQWVHSGGKDFGSMPWVDQAQMVEGWARMKREKNKPFITDRYWYEHP